MSELWLSFFSASLIGLLGSAHCMGMCGGISSSLSMALPLGQHFYWRRLALIMSYNLGRIGGYVALGTLLSLPGALLTQHWLDSGYWLRNLAGVVLIFMGLAIGQWWQGITQLEKLGAPLWARIAPITRKFLPVTTSARAISLGFLWGWLPCGLVYSALSWALLQPSPAHAALIMAGFGLGTLPSMLTSGLLATQLNRLRQQLAFRKLAGIFLILFGLWTLPAIQRSLYQWIFKLTN